MADNAEGRDPGTAEASAPSALTNESVPEEGKGGDGKDAASPTATEESFKVLNRRKSMTRVSREMQRQALEAKAAQLRLRGKQALASHQFELACELLTDAISLCPESYKLHRLRSVAYAALHDYSSALSDAETVIELAPTVSDGYYHKGYALYHMRKFSQAVRAPQTRQCIACIERKAGGTAAAARLLCTYVAARNTKSRRKGQQQGHDCHGAGILNRLVAARLSGPDVHFCCMHLYALLSGRPKHSRMGCGSTPRIEIFGR